MAQLPDAASLGELPVPQASGQTAAYEPPNWRQTGMAGQIVTQAGNQIEQAANEMIAANNRQDHIFAQAGANQLEQARIKRQYDPKAGWALAREGAAATPQFVQDNTAKFQTDSQQIRDRLPTDYARKVYDQHSGAEFARFQGQLYAHQAIETDKFNASTENARLDNFVQQATLNPTDEAGFQKGIIDNINGYISTVIAPRRGLSDDVVTSLQHHYLVAATAARVTALADGIPGISNPDPKAAQHVLTESWNQIGTPAGNQIWKSIQHSVTTFDNAQQGQGAVADAAAKLVQPPLPVDKGADYVKPYTPEQIASRASFVQSPTPWDNDINAAAKATGVSPAEIKLKIAMESMGKAGAVNPLAVDPQGGHGDHATGLGQFTAATAARYGVTDRNDPVQSIWGIARMLKANGGTAGAEMSGSDRAYYGGNPNAKGPNTDQYVENARVLRQAALGGGGAQTPVTSAQWEGLEGAAMKNAADRAEAQAPGNPVVKEGYQQEAHKAWAVRLAALKGQEYSDYTSVLDSVQKTNAQATSDLPPDAQRTLAQLTPQNYKAIEAQFQVNYRAAKGELTHSDPKLFNDTLQRITLPEGDPNKITSPSQIAPLLAKGITLADGEKLNKAIKDFNDPENSPFVKQLSGVKDTGRKMLVGSLAAMNPAAMAHPDVADEAAYRFGVDLDQKVKDMRAAGKDPQTLFQPGSKDYVLDPARVAAFMPTEGQIVARAANGPKPGSLSVAGPTAFATQAEAQAAFQAGRIKPGDRIKVGTQTGTWQ